jgi:hypothetical protein
MKYHNDLTTGSQDMERTSCGLLTDTPTNRQVQTNMPLFMKGGHNKLHIKVDNIKIQKTSRSLTLNDEPESITPERKEGKHGLLRGHKLTTKPTVISQVL